MNKLGYYQCREFTVISGMMWKRVWNSANSSFSSIGDKLREILGLDPSTIVEYKMHKQSLVDGSTFRNAQAYVFAAKPEEAAPATEEKKESA